MMKIMMITSLFKKQTNKQTNKNKNKNKEEKTKSFTIRVNKYLNLQFCGNRQHVLDLFKELFLEMIFCE